MHLASRSCVKPMDDGTAMLGSCNYVHRRGEGNSIQDPKTSKFLALQGSEIKYGDIAQASHIKRTTVEIYNETHRACLAFSETEGKLTIGSLIKVNENCPVIDDRFRFTLLPGMYTTLLLTNELIFNRKKQKFIR